MLKGTLFVWMVVVGGWCALTNPCAGASADAVKIIDRGKSVLIENGLVSFEVSKSNGDIARLKFRGQSILAEAGYLDWISSGRNNHLHDGSFAVREDPSRNGGEMGEVSVSRKHDAKGASAFDVELHYVLRRGDSGPYVFAVFRHPAGAPAGDVDQARWVLRLNDGVFDTINVDETRRKLMPAPDAPVKILGPKESMMITDGPFKGFITDKYHFFVDAGEHFVHGWTGSKSGIGCWVLYGSTEDQNGGPTKQHNSAHFERLLFKILTCSHYGAAPVKVGSSEAPPWSKVYGPWMLYLNRGESGDALWADAKRKASEERGKWPYDWMKCDQYPLASERGVVRGELKVTDPQDATASAGNAWMGLADSKPDWQQQSNGYQFWVRADREGKFEIKTVRAGEYTLYAFVDGVMGEFRKDRVKVDKGGAVDLGAMAWKPVRFGKQVWQIGVPDRTAKEFRHGDDYRQWGLWKKYPEEFPDGVNFVIGKSRERTDWNYAQVNVLQGGQWVGTTWNVIFDLGDAPKSGKATLRLGIAAAHRALLRVSVNGKQVGDVLRLELDNAMIRAGIHGQYREEDVGFDASLLKAGENTISLQQERGGNNLFNVMYDCLRLEVEEK